MELKEELLKIINHYGIKPQLKYFQSEVFELNEAIINYENAKTIFGKRSTLGTQHIAEEIADVVVMVKQLQYYYDINDSQVEEVIYEKVDRQMGRIKNESKI